MGIIAGNCFEKSISIYIKGFKSLAIFFVPYWTVKEVSSRGNRETKKVLIVYVITIIMSLVQNWSVFFSKGLQGLENQEINRQFGYGIGFLCAAVLALMIFAFKDQVISKITAFGFYGIEIFCVLSIAVSYTRSCWLIYLLSIFIFVLLSHIKRINENDKVTISSIMIGIGFILAFVVIGFYLKSHFTQIYEIIIRRFNTIFTGGESKYDRDTLSGRIAYMGDTLVKFKSPRILMGYGYGDLQAVSARFLAFRPSQIWTCENSILYYCWKYGVGAAGILFFTVLKKIKKCVQTTNNKFVVALISYMIAWIPIGLMSGNFHVPFSIAHFAFFLSITQYGNFEDNSSIDIQYM